MMKQYSVTLWPLLAAALLLAGVQGALVLPVLVPGTSCPASGPINYQYLVTVAVGPNGAQPVLASNLTLAPFSNTPVPVESISTPVKRPTVPRTCDWRGRCIEAYELIASLTNLDVGFRNPTTGQPLLSQFLTYDGTVPGPSIVVQQGVQSLVRLHNHIFCNTKTWKPINSTGHWYADVTGLTLHLHGGASLSPFDGWTADNIQACQWKDYVYANQNSLECDWYHDHSMGITAETVMAGLAGTFLTTPCNASAVPPQIFALGPPQYLVLSDNLFLQATGSPYMSPAMFARKVMSTVSYQNQTFSLTGLSGDHNLVNGKIWPVVTVQPKPYWFIMHNGAQTRVFNLNLIDATNNNTNVNAMQPPRFWVVGSEGGLRIAPATAPGGLLLGAGERFQVVIDFSQFPNGTELILTNPPTTLAPYPYFCYTNLVMKFIVVHGPEGPSPPFDANYTYNPFTHDGQNLEDLSTLRAACDRAMNGQADVKMQTTFNSQTGRNFKVFGSMADDTANGPSWQTGMVGDPSTVNRRSLRGAASSSSAPERRSLQVMTTTMSNNGTSRVPFSQYIPHSLPTNGWSTWWMYNNVTGPGGGGIHPIHIHQVNVYLCGRRNNVTGQNLFEYETYVPKDTFFLGASDEMAFITRIGPSQGSYMFHCHNLQHEDDGLMGQYNSTSATSPRISTTFWKGTLSADRFANGFGQTPDSPRLLPGPDPLVNDVPGNPIIGHDLYYAESMPPWAQRTNKWGRPQTLSVTLLRKVLARNYYAVFYPTSRTSLSQPAHHNNYAVMCPATPPRG